MNHGAVSEVVGAFVLVAIGVLAMTVLVLVLYANPLPTKVPSFTGLISNRSTTIYISHEGGDPLYWGQYKILVDNVDETWNFTKSLPDPNRTFSLGRVMNATLPKMSNRVVMIFNTSWGGGTVLLSADLVKTIPFTPVGWYSGDWLYRKKITIDHTKVSGSLTDFPVLISITDVDISGKALHTGNDILFTGSDGMTRLPHEIEAYTWNSGALVAWVKVPSVTSAGDTTLYMYYGNSGAASQQNAPGVWDANYRGVWHLNTVFTDSTSNGNNGANTATVDVGGKIADGRSFDGTGNQYITITGLLGQPATVTLSAWASLVAPDTWGGEVISLGDNVSFRIDHPSSLHTYGFYRNSSLWAPTGSGMSLAGTGWHYITYVANPAANSNSIYIDGVLKGTNGFGVEAIVYQAALNTLIGKHPGGPDNDFNGIIDEVRVSGSARSGQWIQTEYANQNSPGTFSSISIEQTQASMS